MKKLIKLIICIAGYSLFLGLFYTTALAQTAPPLKIHLVFSKQTFGPNEAIKSQIRVYNVSGQDLTTSKGFQNQKFHLKMRIIGPDGLPVPSHFLRMENIPPAPIQYGTLELQEAETISDSYSVTEIYNDLRILYPISAPGSYSAVVEVPFETFSDSFIVEDIGVCANFHDPNRKAYNPIYSNKIIFKVRPESSITKPIRIEAYSIEIGPGSQPDARKVPLGNYLVRLIPYDCIPEALHPVNWKKYEILFNDPPNNPPCRESRIIKTNSKGIATFEIVPQDDYLVIGYSNKDFKNTGEFIKSKDFEKKDPITVNLRVLQRSDGKTCPARTTKIKIKETDLWITEPEYMEWNSSQEFYPFVFEGTGKWRIKTSLHLPHGFNSDHGSLSKDNQDDIQAVQFTITEENPNWEEIEVQYEVKHKGQSETVQKKIDVKLSKKFAQKKGLDIYGHEKGPEISKEDKKDASQDKQDKIPHGQLKIYPERMFR